jgi:hypothetical protein
MKTLRTLAAVLLAAFLVLGPAVVFAASTVTVTTNSSTYSGTSTVGVSGTVTPAPGPGTNVVITTKGPAGAVDTNSVPVNAGLYSYSFVTGGSIAWVQGTYVVNATWGGPGGSASATTSFTYSTGITGQTTITVTQTTTIGVQTQTVTVNQVNPDSAQLSQISSSLTGITTTLNQVAALSSSINTAISGIAAGVTNVQSTLTALGTNLTTLGGIGGQISSMNSAVNNDQTYVLVVAALAAITLVLELAILVRKLS